MAMLNDKQWEYLCDWLVDNPDISKDLWDLIYTELQRLTWRPISEAPRDGKNFLVYTHDINCTFQVYRIPSAGDAFLCWRNGDDLEKRLGVKFVHWMPLPLTPKEGEK